ncbi:MAG: ABC transporter ATP-binding protein [Selenomonadaceae bacterium]|nr:ABC transporter ATP-binding protein [Selenomonadaceae bacterium]
MKSQVFKRLLSYMGTSRNRFLTASLFALLGTALTLAAPLILGEITTILYAGIQDGIWFYDESNAASIWVMTLKGLPLGKVGSIVGIVHALVVIYVVSYVFSMVANRMLADVAAKVIRDIRHAIDAKMHRMKLNYYDTHVSGEVLSIVTNDVETINTFLGKNFYQIVTQSFNLLGIFAMLLWISPWLTLVAVIMIPVTLMTSGGIMRVAGKSYAEQQAFLGEMNGYVEETFNGHDVITSFNQQKKATSRFDDINERLRSAAYQAETRSGVIMPLSQGINYIGYSIAAIIGCTFVINGSMVIGNVQSALQYIQMFQQPISAIAQMAGQVSSAISGAERIFALLDEEEEVPDPADSRKTPRNDGSVEFSHVQFGYTPNKLLMTDVSIKVEPGQKIAIVGPTGAGKTTLINLLMRFYEISGGEIQVDGINSRDISRAELRRHFGMVLQDSWLFEGTIRDNLKYSTEREVSDEEMIAACKSVCADSFIRTMPGGYDMVLAKGASNISQGQRQLLTIARAIIANPEIMILDEATSNVDAHTELVIQEAMATLMKGRTSFVIAHRLSTIRDANVILYMENGDIKEVGDHDALMEKNGKYAVLYNSQFA